MHFCYNLAMRKTILILIFGIFCACAARKDVEVVVLKKARPKPEPARAVLPSDTVALTPVYFEFGKADISPEAREILSQNAPAMQNAKQIIITGGTDIRGTEKRNRLLAGQRAAAAESFYVSLGVNPSFIILLADTKPRVECAKRDEACHSLNRVTETFVKL